MTVKTLDAGIDTWTDNTAGNRSKVRGDAATLRINGTVGGEKYAYLHFSRPIPLVGAQVTSAILRVWLRTALPAVPGNALVRRLDKTWKERTLAHNTIPAAFVGATELARALPANGPADSLVELDVTALIAEVAAGSNWYGFRIARTLAADLVLHSSEATKGRFHPELEVTYSLGPGTPDSQRPAGARRVSVTTPQLAYRFIASEPAGRQQSKQIRIYRTSDQVLVHDSGVVASDQQDYVVPGAAALAAGVPYEWEVRAQEAPSGVWSSYSARASFQITLAGALTIASPSADYPAGGGNVAETTPPIVGNYTLALASAWHKLEEKQDDGSWLLVEEIPRRPLVAGAGVNHDWTPSSGMIREPARDYRVTERAYDALDREALANAPTYAEAVRIFRYARAAVPAGVTVLTAVPNYQGLGPGIALSWTRAAGVPDYWAIYRNGRVVEDRIPGGDLLVAGNNFATTRWEGEAGVQDQWGVAAVVSSGGGVLEESALAQTPATLLPMGAWLVCPERELEVVFLSSDPLDYVLGEEGETVILARRRDPIRQTEQVRGDEGSVGGALVPYQGVSAVAWRDRLEAIKDAAVDGEIIRLVSAVDNYPVILGNLSDPPHPDWPGCFQADVEFWQTGDFRLTGVR